MAQLTLNQIKARLETLALSHRQLNSFYFGSPEEFDANGEIVYAACFATLLPGSIDRTEHAQRFTFRVYFVDLVPEATKTETNETEALSDMYSVAADFMAMLNYTEYQDDWWVEPVTPQTPIEEGMSDMVAGCFIDVQINTEYLADRCQVPADDVTFENAFDMARTRLLTYTGTGAEGSSFSPAGLAGKIVLAVYRAGAYKRVITTAPTDSDKIQVVGTDLGDRKGIQSTTGVVALQTDDALVSGEILDFLIWE